MELTMRVVVVGAIGTIGQAVVQALSARHEIVPVSHSKSRHRVDLASKNSIKQLFETIGLFEASSLIYSTR
jgi:nucleoside-diphosphate-sugar epimerase